MEKEKFIKQRIEIDKVTRKYFDKNYIVIECDCGKSYCNGWRCLTKSDINDENLFNYIKKIENEKQQLISFLEEKIKKYNEEIQHCREVKEEYPKVKEDIRDFYIERDIYQEALDFVNRGNKQ